MNTEFIGEKAFFDEVHESEHAWLAMQENKIFMNKDAGETILLFVWSSKNKCQEYIDYVKADIMAAIEWPIKNILSLFEQIPQIENIAVNPTGQSKQILTYNVEEFRKILGKNITMQSSGWEMAGCSPKSKI